MAVSTYTERERDTYAEVWSGIESYGDGKSLMPGLAYLPVFLELAGTMRPRRLLDVGCGDGRTALAYQAEGFDVTCCDITDVGLCAEARTLPFYAGCAWQSLRPAVAVGRSTVVEPWFDYVCATDVLEHVPPQFTMLAVHQMLRVTRMGLFLSISLRPDMFGVWVGKPLHLTVQPFTWWRDSLSEVGRVADARDLIHTGLFWVTPS